MASADTPAVREPSSVASDGRALRERRRLVHAPLVDELLQQALDMIVSRLHFAHDVALDEAAQAEHLHLGLAVEQIGRLLGTLSDWSSDVCSSDLNSCSKRWT